MGCKLLDEGGSVFIPMHELKYGEVAVLRHHPELPVMRISRTSEISSFAVIGRDATMHYGKDCTCLVRVLQKGEKLEIT